MGWKTRGDEIETKRTRDERTMNTEIHLDANDIAKIVAEKYATDQANVEVICFMSDVGYGMSERKEPNVEAVVRI